MFHDKMKKQKTKIESNQCKNDFILPNKAIVSLMCNEFNIHLWFDFSCCVDSIYTVHSDILNEALCATVKMTL